MKSKYLLYLLLLLALLPVLILRDYTPSNELRYLSIVDEAFRNGSIWAFTNQGLPYADKPPLYFWILMLGKWLIGSHTMWFGALFSFVPALIITGVMDRWVSSETTEANRFTGSLMMMSCGLFLGLAVILRMDILMCMFIVLSLRTFYKMLKGQGSPGWNAFLFPFYVFMAVFSKGPVGILVPLLSTLVFLWTTGRLKTFGRYWGWKTWGILLTGCVVWFCGVYLEGGSEYLHNLLFNQTVNRAVNSFHHDAPFYYYFITVWYSLAPWSLLLIGMLVAGVCRKLIQTELERFFMVVLLTIFVMLSCISSKIAVYLAPAFPFFVYLPVLLLSRFKWNGWMALAVALPAAALCLAAPGLVVLGQLEATAFLGQPFFYAASGVLTVSGIVTLFFLYRKKALNKAVNAMAIGIFLATFVGGWSLPAINNRMGFADLCHKAAAVAQEKNLSGYIAFDISRPENMDAFVGKKVRSISIIGILTTDYSGNVLMVPADIAEESPLVRAFIAGKEKHVVGPYLVVAL